MNNNKKEANRWFSQAESDLKSAKWSKKGGFNDCACFQSQQVVEKALKAFLYSKGERNIIGHSTLFLARRCTKYKSEFKGILTLTQKLDRFYIPTRYPNVLPEGTPHEYFNDEDSKEAIEIAENIIELVRRFI